MAQKDSRIHSLLRRQRGSSRIVQNVFGLIVREVGLLARPKLAVSGLRTPFLQHRRAPLRHFVLRPAQHLLHALVEPRFVGARRSIAREKPEIDEARLVMRQEGEKLGAGHGFVPLCT